MDAGRRTSVTASVDFYAYWGKAAAEGEPGPECHLLAFHSLDVAAVMHVLLERDTFLRRRLTQVLSQSGCESSEEELRRAAVLFAALHDLGKFSDTFQALRPDLARSRGIRLTGRAYDARHDALGLAFAVRRVLPCLLQAGLLRLELGGESLQDLDARELVMPWLRATCCHHGAPRPLLDSVELGRRFQPTDSGNGLAFAASVASMLGPVHLRFRAGVSQESALARASWLLAGLSVLADWLGSNRMWFPYRDTSLDLASYWQGAREQAQRAWGESGLNPKTVLPFLGVHPLLGSGAKPSPLQEICSEVPVASSPQLFLVEDQTGAGKTEAALALAHRLLEAGAGDGLYFALPTMATANAMHARLERARSLFHPAEENASFVLAHGQARSVMQRRTVAAPYTVGEADISTELRAWVHDGPKKALLADVGVGTLDQAMLAVLQARHSTLRLLGLHRHVLLVDEVHACDSYVARVLERLLEAQAALGGSAVLLSATLPHGMAQRFADAFRKGLAVAPGALPADRPFPLVTRVEAQGATLHPCAPRPGIARELPVEWLEGASEAEDYLVAEAEAGRCGCWIRNTVREAGEAYQQLKARLGPDRVQLFHARFLLGDRLRIEREVVERFGRDSTPAARGGRILVATQVVEQSLDLDFDSLVTDLAPVDLVIQRAGRLHRHVRPGRPPPLLKVLAPAWEERPESNWPGARFRGTAAVYANRAELWRTQGLLRRLGTLSLPAQSREVIQYVFESGEVSPGLEANLVRAEDEDAGAAGVASFASIQVDSGYGNDLGTAWLDGESVPTRLGEPSLRWVFASSAGGQLAPLLGGASWEDCTVRLRAAQFMPPGGRDADSPLADVAGAEAVNGCQTVVLWAAGEGCWETAGTDARGKAVRLRYSRESGVDIQREKGA